MQTQTDQRLDGRSNVFLTAAMESGTGVSAVRIRNLSARGALIEAPCLPAIGARVKLVRGELFALGSLAWEGAGQAGINFSGRIDVEKWVRRIGHAGQQSVDCTIAALRGSGPPPEKANEQTSGQTLGSISKALDEVCGRLATTSEMTTNFGEELVKLDSIAQALRLLATGKPF